MTQDPMGRPIPLANLERDVSPAFMDLLRKKIHRRTAANQFANFSWTLPGAIFLEVISILAHLLAVADGRKGKPQ